MTGDLYMRGRRREDREMWGTIACMLVTLNAIATVCIATNIGVLVLPPVVIESPPPTGFITVGTEKELICKAKGTPPLRYSWFKDEHVLTKDSEHVLLILDSDHGSTLRLVPQSNAAEGRYQCKVENDVPGAVAMSDVTDLKATVFARMENSRHKAYVMEAVLGLSVRLPCVHTDSHPPAHVEWTTDMCPTMGSIRGKCKAETPAYLPRNDSRVTVMQDGSLFFSHVTEEDALVKGNMQRVYKCASSQNNMINTGSQTVLKLSKDFAPEYVEPHCEASLEYVSALVGEDVMLECFCKGRPTPQVTWRRLDDELSNMTGHGNTMRLNNVSIGDSGMYQCTGQNSGQDMAVVRLAVESAPEFTERPQDVNATEWDMMHVRCSGTGVPPPRILWYFNDHLINESLVDQKLQLSANRETLILESVMQSMTVHCQLTNIHGTRTAGAYISVSERLPPPPPETTETVVEETTEQEPTTEQVETESPPPAEAAVLTSSHDKAVKKITNAPYSYDDANDTNTINALGQAAGRGSSTRGDEKPMQWLPFLSLLALPVIFVGLIVFYCKHKAHGKKRSYPVDELECRFGYNITEDDQQETESYHSDDSGYDDRQIVRNRASVGNNSISLPDLRGLYIDSLQSPAVDVYIKTPANILNLKANTANLLNLRPAPGNLRLNPAHLIHLRQTEVYI